MSEAMASEHSSAADTRRAILNTLKGSSGNLVEWYDVYIYTVFVSYFEKQFFAPEETNSTIYVVRDLRGHVPHAARRVVVLRPLRRPARAPGRAHASASR